MNKYRAKKIIYSSLCAALLLGTYTLYGYQLNGHSILVKSDRPSASIEASFVDDSGKVTTLSEHAGKVIFINFWATWCPPCIKELPSLNRLYNKLKDNDDIVFFMVEMDNNFSKAAKFMRRKKYRMPIYSISGQLPIELGTNSIPTTIIIDKNGELQVKHMGAVDFDHPQMMEYITGLF